jgi:hypothetical protein
MISKIYTKRHDRGDSANLLIQRGNIGSDQKVPAVVLEGVELKFIDLQRGCAYMYVCSKRGRTLSGRSSLEKMENMIHE